MTVREARDPSPEEEAAWEAGTLWLPEETETAEQELAARELGEEMAESWGIAAAVGNFVGIRGVPGFTKERVTADDGIRTKSGEVFTAAEGCLLAALVWKRFGWDVVAAAAAWRRMLGNSCPDDSFAGGAECGRSLIPRT